MGACCSKEVDYSGVGDGDGDTYEYHRGGDGGGGGRGEYEVRRGDYGACVRNRGSSMFISMATQQGKKGVNQDAMTVWEDFIGEKDVFFCGVFDGHGPDGHKVSRQVRDELPPKISHTYKKYKARGLSQSEIDARPFSFWEEEEEGGAQEKREGEDQHNSNNSDVDNGNGVTKTASSVSEQQNYDTSVFKCWKASITKAFREMDKDLSLDPSIDSYCSGTTAVTVVKQGDHLIIGNLGDSRALLCTRGEKGQVMPVQLTVDLKPSLPREAERITYCKGRVFALDEEPDTLRVWLPDEPSPGLAMTRAFGDFCLKDVGLISIPQLFYRKLTDKDEFVVLATDGVWDVLTNLEVVKIVSSARKRSMAAKLLVTLAGRAWKSRFPTSRADDIAVVVLFLKYPPSVRSLSEVSHVTPDSLSHLNSSVYSRSLESEDGYELAAERNNNNNHNNENGNTPDGWSILQVATGKAEKAETVLDVPTTARSRRRSRMREFDQEWGD